MDTLLNNLDKIGTLTAIALSIVAIVLQSRKERAEIRRSAAEVEKIGGADTTKTYAEAAGITAQLNIELQKRIDDLENKMTQQKTICDQHIQNRDHRISELEKTLTEYASRILELENEVSQLRNKQV